MTDVHAVADLLKRYFRYLPEPLLTFELHPAFIAAAKLPDPKARILEIQSLLDKLPEVNMHTLQYLMLFLNRVTEYSAYNRMNAHNLSIVFGPNLLRPEKETSLELVNYTFVTSFHRLASHSVSVSHAHSHFLSFPLPPLDPQPQFYSADD